MPPFISHLVKVPPLHLVVGFGLVVCMELVGEEVGHSEQDWHMCFAQNAHVSNIFGQAGSWVATPNHEFGQVALTVFAAGWRCHNACTGQTQVCVVCQSVEEELICMANRAMTKNEISNWCN